MFQGESVVKKKKPETTTKNKTSTPVVNGQVNGLVNGLDSDSSANQKKNNVSITSIVGKSGRSNFIFCIFYQGININSICYHCFQNFEQKKM